MFTTDRVCDELTTCTDEEFIETAHTETSNRICKVLRICVQGEEWEKAQPTATSNRVCEMYTAECVLASFYEAIEPTTTSDRQCLALTTCRADEYQTLAPSKNAD